MGKHLPVDDTPYSAIIHVRLLPDTWEAVEASRGNTRRSTWVRRILEQMTHTGGSQDDRRPVHITEEQFMLLRAAVDQFNNSATGNDWAGDHLAGSVDSILDDIETADILEKVAEQAEQTRDTPQ